jgi:hypothetical protein
VANPATVRALVRDDSIRTVAMRQAAKARGRVHRPGEVWFNTNIPCPLFTSTEKPNPPRADEKLGQQP